MDGRWVLTDSGLVSYCGTSRAALLDGLLKSDMKSADRTLPDFNPKQFVKRKGLKYLSRTSQLACAAASGLVDGLSEIEPERVGVVLGTAWAALDTIVRFEQEAHVEGARFVDPILFTETVANVPAGQVSIFFGWSAFNVTVAAGSGSGLEALERGVELLEDDRARIVVAGGADAASSHVSDVTSDERDDPRPGSTPSRAATRGEGAAFVSIESEASASERGARPFARLLGARTRIARPASDPSRRADEIERTLRALIEGAEISTESIGLVVLSTNGDPLCDEVEAEAVERIVGDRTPAYAPKAGLGETWGTGGTLALLAATESLKRGQIPGTPRGFVPGDRLLVPERPAVLDAGRALILDCAPDGRTAAALIERAPR